MRYVNAKGQNHPSMHRLPKGTTSLCNCELTEQPPQCDGRHQNER